MSNPASIQSLLTEGLRHHRAGRLTEALRIYGEVLGIDPGNIDGHHLSAVALHQSGQLDASLQAFERTLALRPGWPEASNNFGNLLRDLKRNEGAETAYRQALAARPDYADAAMNLGILLRHLGRPAEAEVALRHALELEPQNARALVNLGNLLLELGHTNDALDQFNNALVLAPDMAEAYANLAEALSRLKRDVESEAAFARAILLAPNSAILRSNLAQLLIRQGRFGEAIKELERAVELDPTRPEFHSNLLFALSYVRALKPEQLLARHIAWSQRHAPARSPLCETARIQATAGRRLRIGYLSADFRQHAIAHFIHPVIAAHDRSRVDVYCYANVAVPDNVTKRIESSADHWRNVCGLSDQALAQLIFSDRIDVLVDLSGHTAGNRLTALAWRPAPVQATYLGYFATTGMAAIDYWLTDPILHPVDTPERTVEKLWRLPRCWVSYAPPVDAPEVTPPPCLTGAPVTFGSFNHLTKVTPETVRRWSSVLAALPQSRLLLKTSDLTAEPAQQRIATMFTAEGIAADRLIMRGTFGSTREHFGAYGEIDIALDPCPTTGGTTTADALWMGVPVLTVPGHSLVERMSASMLHAIGQSELIAGTEADFVSLAVELARHPDRLAKLRADQRQRMAASPLTDAKGLAAALEAAYREMLEKRLNRATT